MTACKTNDMMTIRGINGMMTVSGISGLTTVCGIKIKKIKHRIRL